MKALRTLAALLLLVCWARASYGDGGTVLLHQDAGPFTVTLFAASEPLRVGLADFSVMLQDKATGDVLLDPVIELSADGQSVRLRRQSGNRLVQSGTLDLSHPGRWNLSLTMQRGQETAQLNTECTVEPNHSRAVIVWFYVLLPAVIILVFLFQQRRGRLLLSMRSTK